VSLDWETTDYSNDYPVACPVVSTEAGKNGSHGSELDFLSPRAFGPQQDSRQDSHLNNQMRFSFLPLAVEAACQLPDLGISESTVSFYTACGSMSIPQAVFFNEKILWYP